MKPVAIQSLGGAEQTAAAMVALCLVLGLPTLLAFAIDTRTLNDISIWSKPMKFQLSFALHWLTLLWLMRCIRAPVRESKIIRRLMLAAALATLIELLYITLQAARGRASHFNFVTPIEWLMYYWVMGPASIVIVATNVWLGYLLWRHRDLRVGRGLAVGATSGLLLSGLLTLLVTAPLAAGVVDGPGHWVGGVRSDRDGLLLVSWSTTGGDLRVAHFFATHLLQFLPLCGWISDRVAPRNALGWVIAASGFGILVVTATLWQALSAHPFLS